MKILIVDDVPQRYASLITQIKEKHLDQIEVNYANAASEAEEKLKSTFYDLLILDVLLPPSPCDQPSLNGSIDLLMEIHEGNELKKPKRIIGITADLNIIKDADKIFSKYAWLIVPFSQRDDDWCQTILNCISFHIKENIPVLNKQESKIDLAIICALDSPELQAVLDLPWQWSAPEPISDSVFIRKGTIIIGAREISVCATAAPRMGMIASSLISAEVISNLKPRLLVMCGICAGIEGKTKIGDVLLADPAWNYESGKYIQDTEEQIFLIAPHQLGISSKIRSSFQQLQNSAEFKSKLMEVADAFNHSDPKPPAIKIGPVASGSSVIANGDKAIEIQQQHRELIGIEMEIYGMYAAAEFASDPKPLFFALKSVCDFANADKNDGHQKLAAYNSAQVLRIFIENFGNIILN